MFGYKLIKKKDLEDLREMQTEVLDALLVDNTEDAYFKTIDVLLKIDDLICKVK